MFLIHHLYTATLISIEEETGLMDSIFSGYKFVPEEHLRDLDGQDALLPQRPLVAVAAIAPEPEPRGTDHPV